MVEDNQNNINVYKFIDSDEEIAHLANNISDLIISGVNCNNIHVINYSNDYLPYIDKIFSLYNTFIVVSVSDLFNSLYILFITFLYLF